MKMRRCKYQSCRTLIPYETDYCDTHELVMADIKKNEELEQSKLREVSQGYQQSERHTRYSNSNRSDELGHAFYQSTQWARLSARVKVRDLYTDSVDRLVYGKGELIVDHIVPRLIDESRALDESNLWLLSREHHNRKTAIEKKMTTEELKRMSKNDWIKLLKAD